MPHDKNGAELQAGDFVSLLCKVKSVQANTDYCNCVLETAEVMSPGGSKTAVVVNTKQTIKVATPNPEEEDSNGEVA